MSNRENHLEIWSIKLPIEQQILFGLEHYKCEVTLVKQYILCKFHDKHVISSCIMSLHVNIFTCMQVYDMWYAYRYD